MPDKPKMESFSEEYMQKWYEEYYDKQFFVNCDGPEYLRKYHTERRPKVIARWEKRLNGIDLTGHIFILGFSTGGDIYNIVKAYPEIEVTAIDFNPNTALIHRPLKKLIPQIKELRVEMCTNIQDQDEKYDAVFATDFFEHTPEHIYIRSIEEIHRILKDTGRLFVFLGKGPEPEHIHLVSDTKVIQDIKQQGFIFDGINHEMLIFKKER